MPTTLPDIILLDAKAAATAGEGVGFGEEMRYSNGTGRNQNKYPHKFKVNVQLKDSTTGASATVLIQESADNSSYTTLLSIALVIGAADPNQVAKEFLFTTKLRYVRANVSALAGGATPVVNAYMTLGSFGQ